MGRLIQWDNMLVGDHKLYMALPLLDSLMYRQQRHSWDAICLNTIMAEVALLGILGISVILPLLIILTEVIV